MQLALRRSAATDATFTQKVAVKAIEARLVTEFPHAGIVIEGMLYHANSKNGLHKTEFTPERWELIDLGTEGDEAALRLFADLEGTKYDWVELFDYTPLNWAVDFVRLYPDWKTELELRMYCYQWCYLAMTLKLPAERVTPETLLFVAARINELRLTNLQERLQQALHPLSAQPQLV